MRTPKELPECEDCADREACFGEETAFRPLGCPNAAEASEPLTIEAWIKQVIDGVGGFHDMEEYEKAVFPDRDIGIASFVIRALANPRCEGSGEVLAAIIERRREKGEGR